MKRAEGRSGRSRRASVWVAWPAILIGLVVVGPGAQRAGAAAAPPSRDAIPTSAATQIAAIEADKESRTPAQRKLDSQLIYEAREDRGEKAVAGAPALTS